MKKSRVDAPRRVRDAVFKEFHHRCAFCGESGPQIHHIDENPENNDPLNLLPLCPNNHLRDIHNPTAKIDQGILKLFRKHKDPAILSPEFEPLYFRIKALMDEVGKTGRRKEKLTLIADLLGFIGCFGAMGLYYCNALGVIFTGKSKHFAEWDDFSGRRFLALRAEDQKGRLEKVIVLAVESLRYVQWSKRKFNSWE